MNARRAATLDERIALAAAEWYFRLRDGGDAPDERAACAAARESRGHLREEQKSAYALLNLFAQYQLDRHWQLGLNLNNVFDRKYYASITDPTCGNYYGEPFNWTLSLRGTF